MIGSELWIFTQLTRGSGDAMENGDAIEQLDSVVSNSYTVKIVTSLLHVELAGHYGARVHLCLQKAM